MEWMLLPLKRYAEFSGRSRRKEYWMFFLFSIILGLIASAIDTLLLGFSFENNGPVNSILSLALLVPSLAVSVRRLHDTGRSGWWLLLIFLVLIGWIMLLIFFVSDSDSHSNAYGSNPKMEQDIGDIFS
ncbi:MAG: DUF805 domain-containing protein [Parasphingorhabdus sp.]|uniref:DUF805 domain-containing protein n=1 Tax=Parasphingorhabdus sp. TaxID=2709688 RepID=UPI0032979F25